MKKRILLAIGLPLYVFGAVCAIHFLYLFLMYAFGWSEEGAGLTAMMLGIGVTIAIPAIIFAPDLSEAKDDGRTD